jgi:protein-L-isoaspartate(D-aspartate) O-methyltransferase
MASYFDKIDKAFTSNPRINFLPKSEFSYARFDMPLSIGCGQTNSQPTVVRQMLEWLDVHEGGKVLDIGFGSGWTTALLSFLTGDNGSVVATERIPELFEFGRGNCEKAGCKNIEFHYDATVLGWPDKAPYSRILVSAGADELPKELVEQLADGGKMVIPILSSIWEVQKNVTQITKVEHKGYIFVPLL